LTWLDATEWRPRLGAGARRRAHDELNWKSVLPRYLATLR
jgi:hypothetical protein